MQKLDAQTVPLVGTNLIEASAGTGKTWTISWLYLRLVAVEGLRVDQILVVTYTEAATAELRDRIRKRLADALAFLEGRASEDTYPTLQHAVEPALGIDRLQLALVSFDEAAVFTIHGFCHRVLTENAFEAGLPFESELLANEDDLLLELADTFWYQRFHTPDALHLSLLQQHTLTPDSLLATVKPFIGKPYLQEAIPALDAVAFAEAKQRFDQSYQQCAQYWMQHRDAISGLLETAMAGKVLSAVSYKRELLPVWCEALDKVFSQVMLPGTDEGKVLERFSAQYLTQKCNKGKTAPEHPFFHAMDTFIAAKNAVQGLLPPALEQLRLGLLHHLRRELPTRKRQRGFLTFDDLLLQLQGALATHTAFAGQLAAKYRAALIDEFQDTDPIQYAIFGSIYQNAPDARVFFVGDPKQAIYGFRGADIHTYLQAAHQVQARYTLGQNFRSHADLLAALNHLFAQSDDPFRSEIAYEPVDAGKPQHAAILPDLSPLRLWSWDSLDEYNSADVEAQIAAATADDIARLLNAGQQGAARIGDEPLTSRDIAVLVRTSFQGERIRQALLERGISSVQRSRDSIFNTREASELRTVLRAIAEPGNEVALKAALVTDLFGYSAERLYALDTEADLLETELEAFHAWHKLWHTQGFMPMFRHWVHRRGLEGYLLAFPDGERRLTNLWHLAELIHTESRLQGHGMHALIRWLQQKAVASGAEETHQLRLESDAELVQIVTIHKSKGLEYGVVYCPYLWQEREPKARTWFSLNAAGKARLQAESLASDAERQQLWEEEKAENLRLLYVALTRAKYHCTVVVVTGAVKAFGYYSALAWLLFGAMPEQAQLFAKTSAKSGLPFAQRHALMQQRLQTIVAGSNGKVGLAAVPMVVEPTVFRPTQATQPSRTPPKTFKPRPVPKVGSFSGLAAGTDDERPDYDLLAFGNPVSHWDTQRKETFPRGAVAGSCLHKMLEELDFTQPLHTQRDTVLLPALKRHGLPERWQMSAELLLTNTLTTQLIPSSQAGDGVCLQQLTKSHRLDELEFYFPVQHLRLKPLQQVLRQHLPPDWAEIHAAIAKLKFQGLTGYMKGFIDLVFEAHGQYFIVDYKSNDLGNGVDDYAQAAMRQAMAEHHYYLQYLIYCVALHRYLRLRLPGYAWETHVGGVLYLFLRGMNPAVAGSGVFFHKPPLALVEALDGLMQ